MTMRIPETGLDLKRLRLRVYVAAGILPYHRLSVEDQLLHDGTAHVAAVFDWQELRQARERGEPYEPPCA